MYAYDVTGEGVVVGSPFHCDVFAQGLFLKVSVLVVLEASGFRQVIRPFLCETDDYI